MIPVTPLELLSLAETRRRDPELALKIADQSALDNEAKIRKETKNGKRASNR